MGLTSDLTSEVKTIIGFKDNWDTREGKVVPEPADIRLGNEAVELDATVLYADLEDSTGLVKNFKWWFAAEVYKSYLYCACKIIRANDGVITSFDGDRVMALFIGGSKNTNAAKTALQINYAAQKIINPQIKSAWPTTDYILKQAVGVDKSRIYAARTGIRDNNDIVWIGKSANYAAKLCSFRKDSISSWITADVFDNMSEKAKYGGEKNQLMWTSYEWPETGNTVYGSSWRWEP